MRYFRYDLIKLTNKQTRYITQAINYAALSIDKDEVESKIRLSGQDREDGWNLRKKERHGVFCREIMTCIKA